MKQKIPVLCYHNILPKKEFQLLTEEERNYCIEIEVFRKQMKLLKILGYKTLTLDEYYNWKKSKLKLPYKSILITFDDGFQNIYDYAIPILLQYKLKACIFIIGKKVGEDTITTNYKKYMKKDTIKQCKLNYSNIEFACHSYNLHSRGSVEKSNYLELKNDLDNYEKIMGTTKFFAYPYGHYTNNIIKVLKEKKYLLAFAFEKPKKSTKISNDFLIPRIDVSFNQKIWKYFLKIVLPFIY